MGRFSAMNVVWLYRSQGARVVQALFLLMALITFYFGGIETVHRIANWIIVVAGYGVGGVIVSQWRSVTLFVAIALWSLLGGYRVAYFFELNRDWSIFSVWLWDFPLVFVGGSLAVGIVISIISKMRSWIWLPLSGGAALAAILWVYTEYPKEMGARSYLWRNQTQLEERAEDIFLDRSEFRHPRFQGLATVVQSPRPGVWFVLGEFSGSWGRLVYMPPAWSASGAATESGETLPVHAETGSLTPLWGHWHLQR